MVFLPINLGMEVTRSIITEKGKEGRGRILIQTEVGLWKVPGLRNIPNHRLELRFLSLYGDKMYSRPCKSFDCSHNDNHPLQPSLRPSYVTGSSFEMREKAKRYFSNRSYSYIHKVQ
jgi:hypothetical protein